MDCFDPFDPLFWRSTDRAVACGDFERQLRARPPGLRRGAAICLEIALSPRLGAALAGPMGIPGRVVSRVGFPRSRPGALGREAQAQDREARMSRIVSGVLP